jgi:ribosomal protein L29
MKLADITKLNDQELNDLIKSERSRLTQSVFDSRTKETHNVKALSAHKKTIARALTIARERDIAKQEATQ